MILRKSAYFDQFTCIAAACLDSCCKEWAIQVDNATARYYRSLPGDLGDRLREALTEEEGCTVLQIQDGRCPMWRRDGLCRIQAELGEGALCETCRDFPRLHHDYGGFLELGLELSCPEAARLILSSPICPAKSQEVPGGGEPEYDAFSMDALLHTREGLLHLLTESNCSIPELLALVLLYGYEAQAQLDGAEPQPFDRESALEEARGFAKQGDAASLLDFFKNLEILTEAWKTRLDSPQAAPWEAAVRQLIWYFAQRYWLQAVSDYDLVGRVKWMVVSCLVIHLLGGDFAATAQLYAKEIENNLDNVEAILDAAYTHPAFTDEKLLGLLLS